MQNKHCYEHNDVTSPEMDGEKGHVLSCDVDSRWQSRQRGKTSYKSFLKVTCPPAVANTKSGSAYFSGELSGGSTSIRLNQPVGGGSTFTFGEFVSVEEAHALVKRRPGSECKMREMSGNHIFEGPYPVKQDCGGAGSDITGCCPPRPSSSSKASELQGHNIFEAFSNPYHYPPPPPMRPYEPLEVRLPPDKLNRNPGKLSSQFRLGGPVCIDPTRPKSESAWARQKMLFGSMEIDMDSYPKPVVSDRKARELAGHTNLFGTPPSYSPPSTPVQERCDVVYCDSKDNPTDSARQVHRTKMQALNGHNAVFMNNDLCCRQEPKRQLLSHAKAQELKGNDIFAITKPDPGRSCSRLQQYYDL